jgi:ankyrin repeat protein
MFKKIYEEVIKQEKILIDNLPLNDVFKYYLDIEDFERVKYALAIHLYGKNNLLQVLITFFNDKNLGKENFEFINFEIQNIHEHVFNFVLLLKQENQFYEKSFALMLQIPNMLNYVHKGETLLMRACWFGCERAVLTLLKFPKLDINATNGSQNTALHRVYHACRVCHVSHEIFGLNILQILIEDTRLDINAKNNNDENVLQMACMVNFDEVAEILIKRKDLKINDFSEGSTPLMWCVSRGFPRCMEVILKRHYVDVNIQNRIGKTALHGSMRLKRCWEGDEEKSLEIVKMLLQHEDIDINLKTNSGETALDLAKKNSEDKIIKLFPLLHGRRKRRKLNYYHEHFTFIYLLFFLIQFFCYYLGT